MEGLGGIQGNTDFTLADWQGVDIDPALANPLLGGNYSGLGLDDAWEGNAYLDSSSPDRATAWSDGEGGQGFVHWGEDGNPYLKIRTVEYDANGEAVGFNEEITEERLYYWSPSDEHKQTGRDAAVSEAAYGKEYDGIGMTHDRLGTNFYTKDQIQEAWDNGDMKQMQEQGITWDQYWGYVNGVNDLYIAGGEANMSNPDYVALLNDLGIPTQFESRGDVYNFNGFGYSRDYWSDKTDVSGAMLAGIAMSAIGGFVVGPLIAGALTPALGAAGAKAASAAITKLAQDYMQTGELNWEDALMSAALSYGGSQLSEALEGSGVLGEIGDKINAVGDAMGEGGGAVLQAALQAGGMSLVTQMVKDGEIDWKDAAIAAAMAGGTALLTSYLSDIGKSDAESEVLEEIKVTAQHKGTLVGEDMYQLEDGTVIYAPAEGDTSVLGNMSTLDLDGDGQLTGNDLQEIQANNYEYKDPNYQAGDSFYDKYPVPEDTESPTLFTEEWANERYGTLSEEQTIQAMQRDGFTDEQIDAYLEGRYDDVGALNPNIVTHAGGWVENMEQPYTLQERNGNYYIIQDGKLKAISAEQYQKLEMYLENPDAVALDNGGMTAEDYMVDQGIKDGGNIFGGYDEYGKPIYNQSTTVEDWITLDGTQPPISAPIDDFIEEPPETPQDPNNTDSSNKPTGEDHQSQDTGAENQSDATGTDGGGPTNDGGGDGVGGPSGGASLPGGNQDSTGNAGGGGNTGGGTTGTPDFSDMTPAEIAAWWAANGGFGNPGGGSTGSGSNDNTSGNTGGSGGDGTTTGDNSGAGGESGAGGGGNSTNTEGGGGTDNTDGGGTGGGTGSGGGEGTGTGGNTDNTGGGDSGTNTGAGTGTGGGAGEGGGTDGTEGGGSGGTSGGGTDGVSGGTGGGAGGGGEGGGGSGGNGNGNGNGMLTGGNGSETEWRPLFPGYQFKKFQYKPPAEPTVGMRLFDEIFGIGRK